MVIIQKIDDFFLIKIYNEYMGNFDVYDRDNIKEFFEDVFSKLKDKYDLRGLLDVDVYVNSEYGMIIEIYPVYSYFEEIDMRIQIHLDSIFMSEINMNEIEHDKDIYYYKGKFYRIYKGICDSEIFYKDTEDIIEKGIKVC